MKLPTIRRIHFHGSFKERYSAEPVEIGADSMHNLMRILFLDWFPDFIKDHKRGTFTIAFEDAEGNLTELFDPEQELAPTQRDIHIMPNPDGAWGWIVAIIIAIISVILSFVLAPKIDMNSETASGANWESPDNVVGQGGIMPVLLGKRLCGSRVVSHGIGCKVYQGISGVGGGGGGGNPADRPKYRLK